MLARERRPAANPTRPLGSRAHPFEVLGHDGHRLGVLVTWAELDDLGPGQSHLARVAGPRVVGLTLARKYKNSSAATMLKP
jgi:hypothetical protein